MTSWFYQPVVRLLGHLPYEFQHFCGIAAMKKIILHHIYLFYLLRYLLGIFKIIWLVVPNLRCCAQIWGFQCLFRFLLLRMLFYYRYVSIFVFFHALMSSLLQPCMLKSSALSVLVRTLYNILIFSSEDLAFQDLTA